jgi:antirestriction protein ArdC
MHDIYDKVTDRIIKALEGGKIPWRRPWRTSWPMNLSTGKGYQGINTVMLSCTEYDQPYWCTFRQANKLGGSIRAGESAKTFVVFAKEMLYASEDKDGNRVLKAGFVLKYSPIFNIEQTKGVEAPAEIEVEKLEAEQYIQGALCHPVIKYGGDRAYYSPEGDHIQMPLKEQFTSSQGYYETLLHEIGHWTGGKSRLNRNLGLETTIRAREELTAEMFAGFALHKVGFDQDVKNVSAYIQSWIRALQNDKKALLWSSREARKAVYYFELGKVVSYA